jgi:hypothetical protein
MSNRREFLKLLGLGAIAPVIPKTPVEPTTAIKSTVLAGKIKTGGLIVNVEGSERMRISSSGMFSINDGYMKKFNEQYEKAIWSGNAVNNKNK